MLSSLNQKESLPYIPSSTIYGYFANEYFKKIKNQKLFDNLFLGDNSIQFSNAYISDLEYNEYIPCPLFIKKYKNRGVNGEVEYVNKFIKENIDNKVEKKITSLDGKYILASTFKKEGVDLNNLKVIEPTFEYAYHHSLDEFGNVKEFFQFLSLAKGQNFVAYAYGDEKKIFELFNKVNSRNVYFGKSRTSQYGKCEIDVEPVNENKEEKHESISNNVLIFKSPVSLTLNNEEIVNPLMIAKEINGKSVTNYAIKYSSIGGFNMLWGLPKQSKTAIDAGSYLELMASLKEIKDFLDKCNVSSLDYYLIPSDYLDKNSSNLKKKVDEKTCSIHEKSIKELALDLFEKVK